MEETRQLPPEPRASKEPVKTEWGAQSVVFTYFQGDINSVVDEHFSRALSNAKNPQDLSTKPGDETVVLRNGELLSARERGARCGDWLPPRSLRCSGLRSGMVGKEKARKPCLTSPGLGSWHFWGEPLCLLGGFPSSPSCQNWVLILQPRASVIVRRIERFMT